MSYENEKKKTNPLSKLSPNCQVDELWNWKKTNPLSKLSRWYDYPTKMETKPPHHPTRHADMIRDMVVITICWCVCINILSYVFLCSKYIMFDVNSPINIDTRGWARQHSTICPPGSFFSKPNNASRNQFVCILFHSLSHNPTLLATHLYSHRSNKWDWSFGFA